MGVDGGVVYGVIWWVDLYTYLSFLDGELGDCAVVGLYGEYGSSIVALYGGIFLGFSVYCKCFIYGEKFCVGSIVDIDDISMCSIVDGLLYLGIVAGSISTDI